MTGGEPRGRGRLSSREGAGHLGPERLLGVDLQSLRAREKKYLKFTYAFNKQKQLKYHQSTHGELFMLNKSVNNKNLKKLLSH